MPPAFVQVNSVLHRMARRLGLETKLLEFHLQRHWPEVVGEHIAAHTRPDRIRFKKLFLIAESSVWAQQLAYLKPSLLEAINADMPSAGVSDIVTRVGVVRDACAEARGHKRTGPGPEGRDPSVESLEEAAAHVSGITDPDLRDRLTQVLARIVSSPARPSTAQALRSDQQPEATSNPVIRRNL